MQFLILWFYHLAQQRAEQAELDKKLAEQRAESLAQRLRELGIEP